MDIKLGLNIYIEEAEEILVENLGSDIVFKKNKYDRMTLFTMSTDKMKKEDFYNHASDVVLKIILKYYFLDNIKKQIYGHNEHLTDEDKLAAYDIAKAKVLCEDNYILDKEYIREEIIQYIEEYPIIYLEGFLMFRLKNLNDFAEMVIEQSIENLKLEKEHANFLEVLKYLAGSGSVGYDSIRLIFEEDGYRLADEIGMDIDKEYFKAIARDIGNEDLRDEDLLISTLVALSPEKILIHIGDYNDEDIIATIEEIFENKVYYCYNCKNCIRKVGLRSKQ